MKDDEKEKSTSHRERRNQRDEFMIETHEMTSIFDRVESRTIESKHRSTREERRIHCKVIVKHDEKYDATLSTNDYIFVTFKTTQKVFSSH